ncbi:MAG TPA: M42 family metallopeptidase [Clostridia bacterium]|nr:M42 family metallopeptidase [Clostridia bacterium]
MQYILEQLKKLTAIPSPSGYTIEAARYAMDEFKRLGYEPKLTNKGCVLCSIGGEGNPILVSAHLDTLGGMVAEVKGNGRLRLTRVGGLQANNVEAENAVVITRFGKTYTGCMQMNDPSAHVNTEYADQKRDFKGMQLVLDERVKNAEDVHKLGIAVGDYVCFDPRTVVTESGYIKSRFLDDKLSVAILLAFAKHVNESGAKLNRRVDLFLSVYEEVGHGCAAGFPEDIQEVLCVDMGCVGEGLTCDEHQVSICAKDSAGPYDYETTTALIRIAKECGIDYAVDIYPSYGSDADAALSAGADVKHALIGAGVYASHGYERSHVDGVKNTLELLKAYLTRA